MIRFLTGILIIATLISCKEKTANKELASIDTKPKTETKPINLKFDETTKTIHILVALCDNKYQGIVPVPKSIGNGQDPKNNLYWGTAYGIKTYFKRSKTWKLLKSTKIDNIILERLVFKHTTKNVYLVADAYNGKFIKNTTEKLLSSLSGAEKDTLRVNNTTIGIEGNASLVAYIGHDGLMDFNLNKTYPNKDNKERATIILACYSKNYFKDYIKNAKATPLVWTTGLMAPEAYTIHDSLTGYVNGETNEQIRNRAATAYNKYQKCGLKGAKKLLVSGF